MSRQEGHHFLNGIKEAVELLSTKIHPLLPHHDDMDRAAEQEDTKLWLAINVVNWGGGVRKSIAL